MIPYEEDGLGLAGAMPPLSPTPGMFAEPGMTSPPPLATYPEPVQTSLPADLPPFPPGPMSVAPWAERQASPFIAFEPMVSAVAPEASVAEPAAEPAAAPVVRRGGGMPSSSPYQDLLASYKNQKQHVQELGQAERAKAGVEAEGAKTLADQQQQDAVLQAAQLEKRKQIFEAESANLEKEMEAVRNGSIDPSRMFSNMDAFQKTLFFIGVALAGFGSGVQGRPNEGIQMVLKMVDQDIEAQKADAQRQLGILDRRMHALQAKEVHANDLELATSRKQLLMYEGIKQLTQSQAMMANSPIVEANNKLIQDAIDEKIVATESAHQRALAAAAGARAAAEERAADKLYERAKAERAEGREDIKLAIEAEKAGSAAPKEKENDAAFRHVTTKLQEKNVPVTLDALSQFESAIDADPSASGIGLVARRMTPEMKRLALSEQGVKNAQIAQNAMNAMTVYMTGKGMSELEAQRYAAAMFGDYSPAALRQGIAQGKRMVSADRENILSGLSPEQREIFESRMGRAQKPATSFGFVPK